WIYQTQYVSPRSGSLNQLLTPLSQVARLHIGLRNLGWRSSVALQALNQLGKAVIVTDCNGRVIELNRSAERILRRDDGLTIRHGKLCALRVFEEQKLVALISAAAAG